jgi:ribosomal protein S12 methylthiotransferase accessory factor
LKQLCRLIGVTRVADLTSLDRAGVRVCAAIRPAGHVLQVSNGKGEHAELGAVAEAAELWASEQVEAERWIFRQGVAYVRAERLDCEGEHWLPAERVWCLPQGSPSMGLTTARWTSNGLGAHRQLERALLHGLLEVIERHALTVTLPEGWAERAVRSRCVPTPYAPPGFVLRAFDLTPRGCPVAVAGALLADLWDGPVPLTAGYAARLDLEDAVKAACEEAFQSRLTDVQGAREDVALGRSLEAPVWLAAQMPRAARPRDARHPVGPASRVLSQRFAKVGLLEVRRLASALERPVSWVELVAGRLPIKVVKVFVEGYALSELF